MTRPEGGGSDVLHLTYNIRSADVCLHSNGDSETGKHALVLENG